MSLQRCFSSIHHHIALSRPLRKVKDMRIHCSYNAKAKTKRTFVLFIFSSIFFCSTLSYRFRDRWIEGRIKENMKLWLSWKEHFLPKNACYRFYSIPNVPNRVVVVMFNSFQDWFIHCSLWETSYSTYNSNGIFR